MGNDAFVGECWLSCTSRRLLRASVAGSADSADPGTVPVPQQHSHTCAQPSRTPAWAEGNAGARACGRHDGGLGAPVWHWWGCWALIGCWARQEETRLALFSIATARLLSEEGACPVLCLTNAPHSV